MTTQLKREIGLFGAVMMGLGSIIGTGVFVSIGLAAGITGPAVILATLIAAAVAAANALNSAQLAANHPVSGGTYAYGYRYLNPRLGFSAGWLFLLAKSASAATAALGFAGYTLNLLNISDSNLRVPLALLAVIAFTVIVLAGIRRSNFANILILSLTLIALSALILIGLPKLNGDNLRPFFSNISSKSEGGAEGFSLGAFLEACALMFVAYTGYGRIATLGEEVHEPRRTIPRAIILTLWVTLALYAGVALVAMGTLGADGLYAATLDNAAPLEAVAAALDNEALRFLVALGAITAMLGVLLNLILGLSRVLLAMGRQGDMPPKTANLNISILLIGGLIAALVLIGNIRTTWAFSAFTVLLYYAITNLAALRLPQNERLYPRWIAYVGLGACAFLAFWVPPPIWLTGLALIALGLIWQTIAQSRFKPL